MSNLELMESILAYWKENKTFQQSIEKKSPQLKYRFFDGPPFASGSPHYGHLLAGSIKDVVPRYMAMRGYQVQRKRGWDCHGLPVEKAVEKALGIDGKKDIEEKIGVEAFVEKCRAYVNQTNEDWHWFIDHTGRWVDFENPYFTMDLDFMESVMRCFSNIYRQNKVYRGFKVQGYCPSCATPLANNEISEGYQDRQDTAITVKFPLQNPLSQQYSCSEDGFIDVVAGVIKDSEGRYAMIHHAKENLWFFPGGKVESGETFELALARELKEEVGIQVQSSLSLGAIKIIHLGKPYRVHRFEVQTQDTPSVQEADKHNALQWVKEEKADNSLGFALNINGNIIDDEKELLHDFIDFHLFKKVLDPQDAGLLDGNFNFLAWTTTPWTLPSNMFLAIGEDIDYVTVYDPSSQEYFVLAENLLKKYFKSPEHYKFIYKQKGKELKNLTYKPLFDAIKNSTIDQKYQEQMFHVASGDFVSTEDGTGIVHIAPSFGVDDFNVVANILGGEHALEWIFMPVDEYGTFDHQFPAFQGQKVMDANKGIIDLLKTQNKVVKVESLNHSYPHCRRCKTPLIYKAMSSWFIKEQEMNAQTNIAAEEINFTPASVKNRFVNGLASAPDWNVARNRYRGSPLPIWQNIEDADDHFAINTLDELYHFTKTGSKNLTKNLFIRHGRTDFNEDHRFDGLGDARLNDLGHQQAQDLVEKMKKHLTPDAEPVFIISPLPRTWQTIKPTLIAYFGAEEIERCEALYFSHYEQHRARFLAGEAKEYIQKSDDDTLVIRLNDQLYIDNRITDLVSYKSQANTIKCDAFNRSDASRSVGQDGENIDEYYDRNKRAVEYWNKKCPTQTLIYVSHDDTIRLMRKVFRNFEYGKYRAQYKVANAEIKLHYRDNERNAEVDLHKPYVDAYRGIKEGKTYKRIPEVLDCWFESGSMPFGQDHYLGEKHNKADVCELLCIRHGQSLFNQKMDETGKHVPYDFWDEENTLSELGKAQAIQSISVLQGANAQQDAIIYVSLLKRAVETIDPYLEATFGRKLSQHPVYLATKERFDKARAQNAFKREDFTNIEVEKNIYLDARIMEWHCDTRITPEYQELINQKGALEELDLRLANFLEEMKTFGGKKVILACHYLVILQLKRYFDKKHYFFDDHNRYPEIDFQNGKIYKFPMDIQTGEKAEYSEDISYPADFIAEGLDQTRGWFRSLHVVGHAIKGENAFKNVVVNGLILAEDGKKMSKSLKNYPDPKDLIEKRGGDAFRLYTLSSPVVRAEPMRFSEKGVEQLFKDFNIPLDNVFKFFETYAKIDQWKSDGTQLFALLDQQNRESQQIQEQLVRIAPDVILVQDESLAQQLQKLASELLAKEIKIQILADASLDELLTQYAGQNLLLLASEDLIKSYREQKYGNLAHRSLNAGQVLKLPTYQLANELDRWILAELHQCLLSVDSGLQNYNLDGAIKTGIDFIEKLSNWYLRRSRRRFRENGMTSDKHSAYATIYKVLTTYLQIMAPFTPFITEHLWQKLANFSQKAEIGSVHLSAWPFPSHNYIDAQLMQEIEVVRRAIKLALFIRSKNKIAVKQPLQSLQIKFE